MNTSTCCEHCFSVEHPSCVYCACSGNKIANTSKENRRITLAGAQVISQEQARKAHQSWVDHIRKEFGIDVNIDEIIATTKKETMEECIRVVEKLRQDEKEYEWDGQGAYLNACHEIITNLRNLTQ